MSHNARLQAELIMLKAKHKRLELDFDKKSTLSKLSYVVCSNIKLLYLKYFVPNEYERILKYQQIIESIQDENLCKK